MKKVHWGTALTLATVALAVWLGWDATAQDKVTPIPVEGRQERIVKQPVGPLMLAKLSHAHRILEGLVTHDYPRIEESAGAMKLMSLDPPSGWEKNDTTTRCTSISDGVHAAGRASGKMAQEKNMAGAAYYQQNLTATLHCLPRLYSRLRTESLR